MRPWARTAVIIGRQPTGLRPSCLPALWYRVGGRPRTRGSREREVVQLLAEGKSNKQVATVLDLSVKTVQTHRTSAMRKLGLKSLPDLVQFAIRNHIVEA